ncbi:FAD-dependent oxidoreductase [Streptomyces antnestii]|uniref:FAD-dependent oxidoreductase n=1 Tax=Streptomyces antnestii TaxID=2494256 RepID=UPI001CB994CE|nr:FAD-dependent oxidoreductase [Streptomyces sp. San01]
MDRDWDHEYDVVVVGSGGGGLTAAITAQLHGMSALVVEKTDRYGGSTALSGGGLWIPDNLYLQQAGQSDSFDNAMDYLDATVGDQVSRERKHAYLTRGQEMLKFLHERTDVHFKYVPNYPDYYPERKGGKPAGRTIEPETFDLRRLGPEAANLRTNELPTYGLTITQYDFRFLNMAARTWKGRRTAARLAAGAVKTLLTRAKPVALGAALVGRLRLALARSGGAMWLNSPFHELVLEDGQVVGLRIEKDGRTVNVRARRGVLFAAGGFSHSQELREKYLPRPTSASWTHSSPGQIGEVLTAGVDAGAALALMDKVWGAPSAPVPGGGLFFLVADRAVPGMVIVNGEGRRFVNEAAPYHEFVDRMYASPSAPENSWIVIDSVARKRYPFVGLVPGQKFPKGFEDEGILKTAGSVRELAAKIDVPADALEQTIARFNTLAEQGRDADFGRGDSAHDRYYGDPTLPNPNLHPLTQGPYYALPVKPGDLGTKGGLLTDAHARVLREDGTPVDGLYATGNCSAAVMGDTYPGPGSTIGPSMTFGYVAATHMKDAS